MPVNKKTSFSIVYVILALGAIMLVHDFFAAAQKTEEIPYSEFRTLVAAGKVAEVAVTHQRVTGKLKLEEGSKESKIFTTVRVDDPDLVKDTRPVGPGFAGEVFGGLTPSAMRRILRCQCTETGASSCARAAAIAALRSVSTASRSPSARCTA